MKHLSYSLIGGIGLLSLQSCASKQQVAEQEYPNVIYVFPDQYRNMAMGLKNTLTLQPIRYTPLTLTNLQRNHWYCLQP